MDPMAIAALGSMGALNFLNLAGSFGSSALQYDYNRRLQDRAFEHQINMYKHQHQWEVDDLRKAGLNPILSTHSSSGFASAPSASVSVSDFSFKNPLEAMFKAQGFSSARDLQKFARENHEVDLALKEADLARKDAEADYVRAQVDNLDSVSARNRFDLRFLEDPYYNELRKLEQVHKVFPFDGEIGFNVGKGKRGKGFGANLNLGDTYSAFGRSHFYKKMSHEDNKRLKFKVHKPAQYKPTTSYKYKYYKDF